MSTQETSSQETPAPDGTFVWHDLMSTDPAGSQAFYSKLFGWNYEEITIEGIGNYPMIRVGESMIGGVVPLEAEGVPSHWMGYVSVADVDAAAKTAAESGGQICVPGTDMPNIGRFAVITDPSGAAVSLWKSAEGGMTEPEKPATGTFVWNELLTNDPAACTDFYPKIFDWKHESMAMPGPGGEMTYHLFKRTDQKEGSGMMQMPPGAEAPSHWLPYVAVEDVDASVEQAKGLGANVYCEPTDIPNVGRFAVLADPQGATFAVYKGAPTDC